MTVSFPSESRNYCRFDEDKISRQVLMKEKILPHIKESLASNKDESSVVENLYLINRLLDEGIDKNKIIELYPQLSRYNNTDSPNIQTFLAGIYRKTKIPDAFGPLVKMLIKDSINDKNYCYFDPTEEIGGAILDYLA